jgi:hypothetical protein
VLQRLPDRLWVPAVIVLLLGGAMIAGRLIQAADGDASRFVVAGDVHTSRRDAPTDLFVTHGDGYDGQYVYRLARDPFDLADRADGITFDVAMRRQRIAYPAVVFAVTLGAGSAVPWALILVNLAALTAIAGFGGAIARDAGRHAFWGILPAVYFGLVFSTARDLTEVVECAFLVGGLVALRRERWWIAALALAAAVLARETALVAVAAYGAWRVIEILRRRRSVGAADAAWVVPVGAFGVWQVVCATAGTLPVATRGGNGTTWPFRELASGAEHWFDYLSEAAGILFVAESLTLLGVFAVALWSLPGARATPYEKIAVVASIAIAFCATTPVGAWREHADLRIFADAFVLSSVIVLGTRRRVIPVVPVATACVALCWVGAAALRVRTL